LEKNLIHDILHNMYQVQAKEFRKDINKQQYSESEIIEEIEVLGMEETFMKYMNIPYPKTDFINQNINMLVSHLMLTILRHDSDRVVKILNGDVEPYIEVYGKQYPVADTPFAGIFDLFQNTSSDKEFNLESEADLRKYLIRLINIGRGISESSGDRARYPDGEWFGDMSFYDLDADDQEDYYDKAIKKNDYVALKDIESFYIDLHDLQEKGLYKELKRYLGLGLNDEEEEGEDYGYDPNQLEIPFNESSDMTEFDYKSYIGVKLRNMKRNGVDLGEDTAIDDYIITIGSDKCIIWDGDLNLVGITKINEEAMEAYENSYQIRYDDDHWFINEEQYKKKTTKELVDEVLDDSDSLAILRRNFRTDDVVRNNTKLGAKVERGYWDTYYPKNHTKTDTRSIEYEKEYDNPKKKTFRVISFESKHDFPSLSKVLTTDNAKKLHRLLDELRGYVIKNIDSLKAKEQESKAKFSKGDIATFKSISKITLQQIPESIKLITSLKKLTVPFALATYYSERAIAKGATITGILKSMAHFKRIKEVMNKIQTKDDMDYMFNWVNNQGVANYESFEELSKIVNDESITKYIENLEKDLTPAEEKFINGLINMDVNDLSFRIPPTVTELTTKAEMEEMVKKDVHRAFKQLGKFTLKIYWKDDLIPDFLKNHHKMRSDLLKTIDRIEISN
jgi:hypothetical protein